MMNDNQLSHQRISSMTFVVSSIRSSALETKIAIARWRRTELFNVHEPPRYNVLYLSVFSHLHRMMLIEASALGSEPIKIWSPLALWHCRVGAARQASGWIQMTSIHSQRGPYIRTSGQLDAFRSSSLIAGEIARIVRRRTISVSLLQAVLSFIYNGKQASSHTVHISYWSPLLLLLRSNRRYSAGLRWVLLMLQH